MAASRNSPPSDQVDLGEHLAAVLRPAVAVGDRLCVGLSGGRDSVALLHLLTGLAPRLGVSLAALHVNHGLSPHADRWQAFCADLCAAWAVPFRAVTVAVSKDSGEGVEAAARRLRYQAFAACGADWLLLAHHRDDQAETVLLRLLRGAGVRGAAGMPAVRALGGETCLLRPLLDVPRTVIDEWCAANGLAWIDDESNADARLRRNFLRHEIMPRLADVFPAAAETLARAAGHFAESARLLADLAAIDRAVAAPSGRIAVSGLLALPPARARNLLRDEIAACGGVMPDARRLGDALRQVGEVGGDNRLAVDLGGVVLHAWRGELYFDRRAGGPLPDGLPWCGEPELPWGGGRIRFVAGVGDGLSARLLDQGAVTLRPRRGGERLQPDPRRPRRTLKNLLQESAIPPWQRERLPLLWCGDSLAWVGGIGTDARFLGQAGEAAWQVVWEPPAQADFHG